MARNKYVIKVNGRKVWEGTKLAERFWAIKKKNRGAKVSVSVVANKRETLIVIAASLQT
ncbi:MAG TPA: hypothetical protein VI893_05440 [Thermoplasmata archaeon]|nr:hypothetical protein [Thermoplasmata archaeon]